MKMIFLLFSFFFLFFSCSENDIVSEKEFFKVAINNHK
jgi:hypothetical protein